MNRHSSSFKWRHYAPDVILLCVRWYCRYQLSYRDVEEMMRERGLDIDHSTVFRWVQRYTPEINKRIRPHLKMSGTSYRVDETYIKVGKICKYLCRAVDKEGQTIEFMLSAKRDVSAAKRFFKKMVRADHRRLPFSISVDKNAAYPDAFSSSQDDKTLPADCLLRRVKYLNNVIEQDHRFIKKKVRAGQCCKNSHSGIIPLKFSQLVSLRLFMKHTSLPFKWRHYPPELILLCVRWYCRYQLSYRDVEEMMRERGLDMDHSTVFRWVQRYAPEINKRIRPYLKMSGTSYRVDETYIKVGKTCKYLYRAVDEQGQTIEFMLSAKRDVLAAKRFFRKMMRAEQRRLPFSISVDKNAAYPDAFTSSLEEKVLPSDCTLRRVKYLNNIIEQDHRFIKKKVRASQCFKRFHTAEQTLEGIEAVNMMRKGQVKRLAGGDARGQAQFVASLFQIAA